MTALKREASFQEAIDEHLGAVQARDTDRFEATLGRDVAVVDGRGRITRGIDDVLRAHAEWFRAPERWAFDYDVLLTRETASSGFALLDVTYRHTPESEPSRFLLSLLFERDTDGVFKFVYDQNTPLA